MTDEPFPNGGALKERVRNLEDIAKELKASVKETSDSVNNITSVYITRGEYQVLIDRTTSLENQISALKERLTIYNLAQASFTTIIGAVAVIVGVLFK